MYFIPPNLKIWLRAWPQDKLLDQRASNRPEEHCANQLSSHRTLPRSCIARRRRPCSSSHFPQTCQRSTTKVTPRKARNGVARRTQHSNRSSLTTSNTKQLLRRQGFCTKTCCIKLRFGDHGMRTQVQARFTIIEISEECTFDSNTWLKSIQKIAVEKYVRMQNYLRENI